MNNLKIGEYLLKFDGVEITAYRGKFKLPKKNLNKDGLFVTMVREVNNMQKLNGLHSSMIAQLQKSNKSLNDKVDILEYELTGGAVEDLKKENGLLKAMVGQL